MVNSSVNALVAVSLTLLAGCVSDQPLVSNSGHLVNSADGWVSSMKALNEKHVVMQKYDYSCGAASLATLMRYYFGDDVTEQFLLDTVKGMFSEQEYEVIADRGLSFLELSKVSESLGYQSASVRLKLSALPKLKGPILVYVETVDYKHFAILRGVQGRYAYLADPSRGNIRLSIDAFSEEWKGESFILGREDFGVPLRHSLSIFDPQDFHSKASIFRQNARKRAPTQRQLLERSYGI